MLKVSEQVSLSAYTTLRLGGPAARLAEADLADDLVAAVRAADLAGEPLLVLGGGSNLVIADEGFDGTVLKVATSGVAVREADDRVLITAAAGEDWDRLAEWAVSEKLAGIECLSGIPGQVGATPIQNVGAYGQEVSAVVDSVTVLDRTTGELVSMRRPQFGFGYRTSVFKATAWPGSPTGRYVVLDVTFALARDPMSTPVRYAELAGRLGVATGEQAPLADVRDAVLALRRGKGMVLDPADPDTASAGSFFTNALLSAERFAGLERIAAGRWPGISVPSFPAEDGQVKVPAGWLIERAGFGKGYRGAGRARVSSKHTLALTNAGGASTAELIGLASEIVTGVRAAFGVELVNEPTLVGVTL